MKTYLLAQNLDISGIPIQGPLVGIDSLGGLVNKLMVFIIPFSAIILFFILLWGGVDLMTSQGVPEKIKIGRGKIMAGLIGFILLVSSYLIVRLISVIFGFGGGII